MLVFLGVNFQRDMGHAALIRWGFVPELAIYEGKYWGVLTLAFVHTEPFHIFFNLYWLWIFGNAFEKEIGSAAMAVFVLASAFISSGISLGTEGYGIGLSGVGYALFGFGWVVRRRYPEFARTVQDRTVQVFVGWFFLCVALTYAHIWNIGNVAHLTGLVFGAAVGTLIVKPKLRIAMTLAIAAMAALSVVPLFYSPFSAAWNAHKVKELGDKGEFAAAIPYLKRITNDETYGPWAWQVLAGIYGDKGDTPDYQDALQHVKDKDPEAAKELENDFHKGS